MFETTKDPLKPYDFETNKWCMYVGFTGSNYAGQSLRTITQVKENMVGCGYEYCSDMGNERQFFLFFHEDRKEDEYSCSYEEQREGLHLGEEGCPAEGHSEYKS